MVWGGVVGVSEQVRAKLQKTRDGKILGACLFIPAHILPDLPPDTDSLDFVIQKSDNRLTLIMKSNFSKEGDSL